MASAGAGTGWTWSGTPTTSGFESDLYLRNAWRYRDYVIASFNQDKPYDQFIKEQIAADEIWPDDNELEGSYILPKKKQVDLERRIGTGMYTVGSFDPSSALDGAQLRYDRLTDMADTTASAFLGLSMGCARCHDHKFDPITQKDYYRLQAIFAGSQEQEIPVVDAVKIITWRKSEPKQLELNDLRDEVARMDVRRAEDAAASANWRPATTHRTSSSAAKNCCGRSRNSTWRFPSPMPRPLCWAIRTWFRKSTLPCAAIFAIPAKEWAPASRLFWPMARRFRNRSRARSCRSAARRWHYGSRSPIIR